MPVVVHCPSCRAGLRIPDEALDRQVRCPKCKSTFRPRDAQTSGAAPPPAPPAAFTPVAPAKAPPREADFQPVADDDEERPRRRRERRDEDEDLDPPSGVGLSYAVRVMLGLAVFVDLGQAGLNAMALANPTETMVGLVALCYLAYVLLFVSTGIFFMIWFRLAYKNLRGLGIRGQSYSPGWAIGYFFVPFLNLVRPYEIAQEIWKGSQPPGEVEDDPSDWKKRPRSGAILAWWLTWLLANILANAQFRILDTPNFRPDQLKPGFMLGIASHVASFIAGVLLIGIMGSIVRRQEESWVAIEETLDDVRE